MSDLVIDVGMHKGEDTAYYLAKGFRVVAIEADPELAQACRLRFTQEIARGQLDIIEGAIANGRGKMSFFRNEHSVWGSVHKDWADRDAMLGFKSTIIEVDIVDIKSVFRKFGVSFYLKLDIEGGEKIVLSELLNLPSRPHFISLESEKVYFRKLLWELRLLVRLGYNRFKVVQQQTIPGSTVQTTDCDGRSMTYRFEDHSSGPFGDDASGKWLTYRRTCFRYAYLRSLSLIRGLSSPHKVRTRIAFASEAVSLMGSACSRLVRYSRDARLDDRFHESCDKRRIYLGSRVPKMRGVVGVMAAWWRAIELSLGSRNCEQNQQAGSSGREYCWPIGKTRRFLRSVGRSDCIIRPSSAASSAPGQGPMAALDDRPRPGREPTITLETEAWLVSLACRKAKDLGYPTHCGRPGFSPADALAHACADFDQATSGCREFATSELIRVGNCADASQNTGRGELYAFRSNKLGPVVARGKSGKLCRWGAICYRFHVSKDVGHPSGLALAPSLIL